MPGPSLRTLRRRAGQRETKRWLPIVERVEATPEGAVGPLTPESKRLLDLALAEPPDPEQLVNRETDRKARRNAQRARLQRETDRMREARALIYRLGVALVLALVPLGAGAACPDLTAPAGRVRVQFPGPCDPARPFLAPLVDVGIALQTLPGSDATGPGVPYLIAPGECVWLERRWLPCLRSRCVGATSDVEPGDLTRPRGMGATPGATCAREWGAP